MGSIPTYLPLLHPRSFRDFQCRHMVDLQLWALMPDSMVFESLADQWVLWTISPLEFNPTVN